MPPPKPPPMTPRPAFAAPLSLARPAPRRPTRACGARRAARMGAAPGKRKSAAQLARDAARVYACGKPWWCQPWTIVGTGAAATGGSAALFHTGWARGVPVLVGAGVLAWWFLFLVVYPQQALGE